MTAADHANTAREALAERNDARVLDALDALVAQAEAAENYAGYGEILEGLTQRAEAAEAERDRLERQLAVAKTEHDTLCGDYGRLVDERDRLADALRQALDCKGSYNGTVSERGGEPAICTKCEEIARAALETLKAGAA